jgi:hypothetical protein
MLGVAVFCQAYIHCDYVPDNPGAGEGNSAMASAQYYSAVCLLIGAVIFAFGLWLNPRKHDAQKQA